MKPTALNEIVCLFENRFNNPSSNGYAISGVAVDSRLIKQGDLFFALPGEQTDGHHFLKEAASAGAVAAVVKNSYQGSSFGMPLIYTEDVLKALQQLASAFISKSRSRIVAVTGSLGKTTTKDFIGALLSSKFSVSASPGNSNSQIGLPLAILNHASLEEEILVLEMGMTLPGHISQLIDIAPPVVAIVTTVALVHACNFNSIADIARAKSEIFSHSRTELGIYHKESDYEAVLSRSGNCRKISFSTTSSEADLFLETGLEQYRVKEFDKTGMVAPLELPGTHNRHNFLAAIAIARYFGMTWEEIRHAQINLKLPERRLQQIEKFGAIFINDSYNASEMSVKAALSTLPEVKIGAKRIAVLGEMVELGKFSEQCHYSVGEYALNYVDRMICFGEGCLPILKCWQKAGRPIIWSPDRAGAVAALRQCLQSGDVVLLKGSRAKGVWKVLDEL